MPVSLADVVPALLDEYTQKLLAVLRTAAVAELSGLTFDRAPVASSGPAPAEVVGRRTSSSSTKRPSGSSARSRAKGSGQPSARRPKPSLDEIAALLQKEPGIGSEEIQRALGSSRIDIRVPLARGLSMGVLRKTGEKRATKYFTASGVNASEAPTRLGKKPRDLHTPDAASEPSKPPR